MADQTASHTPDAPANQSTRQLLDDLDALMQRMLALPVNQNEPEAEITPEAPRAPEPPPAAATPAVPVVQPRSPQTKIAPTSTVMVQQPLGEKPAQYVVSRQLPSARPAPAVQPPLAKPAVEVQPPLAKPSAPLQAPLAKPAAIEQTPAAAARPIPVVHSQPRQRGKQELQGAPTYVPVGAEPLLPFLLQRQKATPEKSGTVVVPPTVSTATIPPAQPSAAPRPVWLKTPPAPPGPTAVRQEGRVLQMLLALNRAFDRGTTLFGSAGRWLRSEQGRTALGWSGIAMVAVAVIWVVLQFLG